MKKIPNKNMKHKHKFKLAQVVKEANFSLSMCGIYQDKAYIICEECGEVRRQWLS